MADLKRGVGLSWN